MFRRSGPARRRAQWAFVAACAMGAVSAVATHTAPSTPHRVVGRPAASQSHLAVVYAGTDTPSAPPAGRTAGRTTLHVLVANQGSDPTASSFTVRVTLPTGATAAPPYFPTSCTGTDSGTVVTCTFPPSLPVAGSATVLVPVQIVRSATAHSLLTGGWVHLDSADHANAQLHDLAFAVDRSCVGARPATRTPSPTEAGGKVQPGLGFRAAGR
jgi:hypothetical protein